MLGSKDELYLWDKVIKDDELKSVSLHTLLIKVAAQIDPTYSVK